MTRGAEPIKDAETLSDIDGRRFLLIFSGLKACIANRGNHK